MFLSNRKMHHCCKHCLECYSVVFSKPCGVVPFLNLPGRPLPLSHLTAEALLQMAWFAHLLKPPDVLACTWQAPGHRFNLSRCGGNLGGLVEGGVGGKEMLHSENCDNCKPSISCVKPTVNS